MAVLSLRLCNTGETIPIYDIDLDNISMDDLLASYIEAFKPKGWDRILTPINKNNIQFSQDDLDLPLSLLGYRDGDEIPLTCRHAQSPPTEYMFQLKIKLDNGLYKFIDDISGMPLLFKDENESIMDLIDTLFLNSFLNIDIFTWGYIYNETQERIVQPNETIKTSLNDSDIIKVSSWPGLMCHNITLFIPSYNKIFHFITYETCINNIKQLPIPACYYEGINMRIINVSPRNHMLYGKRVSSGDCYILKETHLQYIKPKVCFSETTIEIPILDIKETISLVSLKKC